MKPSPRVLFGFQCSTYVSVTRLLLHAAGVAYEFHDTEAEMHLPELVFAELGISADEAVVAESCLTSQIA